MALHRLASHSISVALLLLVLHVCSGVSGATGLAVAQCTTAAECNQTLPNAASMRCRKGSCIPLCKRGFKLTQNTCISANITCLKGQQPGPDGLRCVSCPQNTYKAERGNMPCRACPAGTLTAGRKRINHDDKSKCLPGGLGSSAKDILPPRVRVFQQQLQAAAKYMQRSPLPTAALQASSYTTAPSDASDTADAIALAAAAAGVGGLGVANNTTPAAVEGLTEGVAYIAGSPLVMTPYDSVLRMPSRKLEVQDQGSCATCVNMAIANAAEASVASVIGRPVDGLDLSPIYGYYCEPPLARSCSSGWTFAEALDRMQSSGSRFLPSTSRCGTEDLEWIRSANPNQLATVCDSLAQRCDVDGYKRTTGCTYKRLQEMWQIQKAIRVGGAVITRIDITPGFVEFFRNNATGVYTRKEQSADTIPHAVVLVGYDNTKQYWWAQNSYGTSFADQGVFKLAYGVALAANPNETFAIACDIPAWHWKLAYPWMFNTTVKRWPLKRLKLTKPASGAACFNYTARDGDYIAGVAEHFGLDLLDLLIRNAAVFDTTAAGLIDLTTPIEGRVLTVCGITKPLPYVAALDCSPGEYQDDSGSCEVCPLNTYKETIGPERCLPCADYNQGQTDGCTAADHDSREDCKPKQERLLCEQFIGIHNVSGVYNVTLGCKQYQVYCDMEVDGGGWALVLNYNVAAGTFPETLYLRTLNDGFPLLPNPPNNLGTDESSSHGPLGSWGHLAAEAMAALPVDEFRATFEMGNPIPNEPRLPDVFKAHYKSIDPQTIWYLTTNGQGVNSNSIRHECTPLPGWNSFIPLDGMDEFSPQVLWGVSETAGVPVRHQVFVRGRNPNPPTTCPPGYYYSQGWDCHLCPDHTYKTGTGLGPCTPCPVGTVATAGMMNERSAKYHDQPSDCKPAVSDASWNITKRDGSKWTWDFFWNSRARSAQAEQICQQHGGHLITIESGDTAALLSVKVSGEDTGRPAFPLLHSLGPIWMGLYSDTVSTSTTGPWKWYSGARYDSATNYTNWQRGNPDYYRELQGTTVAILYDNSMMWDDYYTNFYLEFICEKPLES